MMQPLRARVRFAMQRKWKVSLVVLAGVFMSSLDLFIVNIAFPAISKHFGSASVSTLSWVLSAYAIVFAALLVPAGRWADAFGRKRAFLLGLAIFVAASPACAAAPSVDALVAARVVQADWRLVFLVNVPVGLAALAAGVRTLRERREQDAERPDLIGAATLMVAVGALVVAIVQGQQWGWGSPAIIALLLVPVLVLPWLWRRSERHPAPIVEPSMLRVPRFALAVGASLMFFAGF